MRFFAAIGYRALVFTRPLEMEAPQNLCSNVVYHSGKDSSQVVQFLQEQMLKGLFLSHRLLTLRDWHYMDSSNVKLCLLA